MLHQKCAALRTILIPDFSKWEQACSDLDLGISGHRSILLLAFERGYLHRLTRPIHKHLMDGDLSKLCLKKQYRKDLQELWFVRHDPMDRHRKSKGYLGRLSELVVVRWAEEEAALKILGLEATGSSHDILVASKVGAEAAIEVKFIGTEDREFEKALAMDIFVRAGDLPTTSDFLLTRIYEAAKQLTDYPHRKVAIVVIDEQMAWPLFDAALNIGPFDLKNPKLVSTNEGWLKYLESLKEDYPDIDKDLAATIRSLDGIFIFRLLAKETLEGEMLFPSTFSF